MLKLKALAIVGMVTLAFAAPALGAPETSPEALYQNVKVSFYKMGHLTASGQRFSKYGLTCAHRTLPFGTRLKVTNPKNGKFVYVTVTDRGPFIKGVVLDLSQAAFTKIGSTKSGVIRVNVENEDLITTNDQEETSQEVHRD